MHHTATGAVVEAIWIGRCKNDIVRPDGNVAVKANGEDFVCHVCFVMDIDPENGITKIDEYYSKAWWDGISEREYLVMGVSSNEPEVKLHGMLDSAVQASGNKLARRRLIELSR